VDIIEKLAAIVGSDIQFTPGKCLHSADRTSTCDNCVAHCPTGAITGPPINHNTDRCVKCGLCLHTCPTGAFNGDDSRANLLAHVAALAGRGEARTLEFVCKYHPAAEEGPADASGVLRLPGCLGALSPSAFVAMAALGVETVSLRLDRCQNCPLGHAVVGIERAVGQARRLLDALDAPGSVQVITGEESSSGWGTRRVIDTSGRPVFSRRGLFAGQEDESPLATGHALAADESAERLGMPRERLRLLLALARLPGEMAEVPAGLGFARVEASADCTACGMCARICPTGALRMLEGDGGAYYLVLRAGACVDCGLCLTYCEPGALHAGSTPTLADLLCAQPVVLAIGSLRKCKKCGARFAGTEEQKLCPVCEFRRRNPFGFRLPAGSRGQARQTEA